MEEELEELGVAWVEEELEELEELEEQEELAVEQEEQEEQELKLVQGEQFLRIILVDTKGQTPTPST